MSSGYLRESVVAPAPVGPPVNLIDAAIRPGPAEADLDGRSMVTSQRITGTGDTVRGYRWEAGFRWRPRACGPFGGRNECAPYVDVSYNTQTVDAAGHLNSKGWREHQPVIIDAQFECTGISADFPFYRQSAIDALVASEPKSVEAEFWEGPLAKAAAAANDHSYDENLWLTKHGVATDVTPSSGAVSVARGLAELEQFLADTGYGSLGIVHCQPRALPPLPGIRPVGQRLYTARGTLVVPGVGYSGRGPAATDGGASVAPAAGKTWLYATGLVTYRQGDIVVTPDTIGEAMDRTSNDVVVTAERSSAMTWDGCAVGAVLVNLPA